MSNLCGSTSQNIEIPNITSSEHVIEERFHLTGVLGRNSFGSNFRAWDSKSEQFIFLEEQNLKKIYAQRKDNVEKYIVASTFQFQHFCHVTNNCKASKS